MKIRTKVIGSGLVSLSFALLLGGIGLWGYHSMTEALVQNETSISAMRKHMEADMMHDAIRADVLAALLVKPGDAQGTKEVLEAFDEHTQRMRKVIAENAEAKLPGDVAKAIVELKPQVETYIDKAKQIISKALSGAQDGQALRAEFDGAFSALEERNEAVSELIENQAQSSREHQDGSIQSSERWLIVTLLATCVALALLSWSLLKAVLTPLNKIILNTQAISQGDLQRSMGTQSKDELGQLQGVIEQMQTNLRQMIATIRSQSDELHGTSRNLGDTARAVVLRWWPTKCATWRRAPPSPPRKSPR